MDVKSYNLLDKIKIRRNNSMIKIITGIRRCGKSYLLFNLFPKALIAEGVKEDHIIKVNLEDRRHIKLRDPDELLNYIDAQITDKDMYYILLDEVQMVPDFEDVLNSFLHVPNADVFATGSNAKFLSKDVITEFRGRGDEIRIHPFSFNEYLSVKDPQMPRDELILEYMTYGGLPQVVLMETESEKRSYLRQLFAHTYLKDIKERYNIKLDSDLEDLVNILASSIGSLTNPHKLAKTFKSVKNSSITQDTIKCYLDYLEDAFLVEKSLRYDIKGKRYIDTPYKFYFEDLGLRNARLNFRQIEATHLMENMIYNELRRREFDVDVGEVIVKEQNGEGKVEWKSLEVDFVCNQGYKRYYIQSAWKMPDKEKEEQESRPFRNISDSFKKIIVTGENVLLKRDENGIVIIPVAQFLKDPFSMDL